MDSEERQWLIEVKNDVQWLKTNLSNHLHHHLLYTLAFIGAFAGIIIALFKR